MQLKHTIVGLGNPGKEYSTTRHNIGYRAVEAIAGLLNVEWQRESAFGCRVATNEQFLLIKPEKYMNTSGEVVAHFMSYHWKKDWATNRQTMLKQLSVLHDDLDIALGEHKIQFGVGPKVHNGLTSMYAHLGSHDFWHVRIGIDGRGGLRQQSGSEYVLGQFLLGEEKIVQRVLVKVSQEVVSSFKD